MGSLRDAVIRRLGDWCRSRSSLTAAPRPAARDQRPCRGHGRLLSDKSCFSLPASWPLLPLRDGHGFAAFSLLFPFPLRPPSDEGRRGNFKWGGGGGIGTSGCSRQGEVRGEVLVSLERCLCLRWCSLLGQFSPRQLSLAKHERAGVGCHRVRDSVGDGKGRVRE